MFGVAFVCCTCISLSTVAGGFAFMGSSGTTPSGTTPSGTTPSGTTPSGTTPSSTTPSGTTPSSTTPSGTTPSGTTPPAPPPELKPAVENKFICNEPNQGIVGLTIDGSVGLSASKYACGPVSLSSETQTLSMTSNGGSRSSCPPGSVLRTLDFSSYRSMGRTYSSHCSTVSKSADIIANPSRRITREGSLKTGIMCEPGEYLQDYTREVEAYPEYSIVAKAGSYTCAK